MPYIAFESGALPPEIKLKLIVRLTEVASEVTGIPPAYFFVALRELPDENLAIAGTNVRALKAELARGG